MAQLNGQSRLLQDRLPPPPARLLWLSPSSNSIGDSLMELSGRALLGAYEVDLFTKKSYAELYRKDRYLRAVFSDPEAIDLSRYDFGCRTSSTPARSVSNAACAPACRSLHCKGSFGGPITTACCSVAIGFTICWAIPYTAAELRPFLRPRLFLEDEPAPLPKEPGAGAWPWHWGGKFPARTYRRWPEVIRSLITAWPSGEPFPEFVLVGSRNGLTDRTGSYGGARDQVCQVFC